MNLIIRTILAVLAGLILGSMVNMGIIMISPSLIPPPPGADVTSPEGLKESIHLFTPKNFVMPFLAHALGTMVGAFVAARIALVHKLVAALIVGGMFCLGGIINVFMLPAPGWFVAADLVLAYLPMAYLGWRLAGSRIGDVTEVKLI